MPRLAVLLLLLLLFWIFLEVMWRRLRRRFENARRDRASGPPRATPERGLRLVRCAACGVHIPAGRALTRPGAPAEVYCSEGCLKAAANGPS